MVDGFSAGGSVLSASHTTSQCKAPRRRSRRRAPASHRAGVLGVQRPFIDDGAVPPRLTLLPHGASAGRTSIALWMNPLGRSPTSGAPSGNRPPGSAYAGELIPAATELHESVGCSPASSGK